MITAQFLSEAFGRKIGQEWCLPMRRAIGYANLSTTDRLSCFIGQVGHESGGLRWMQEIWGPTAQQLKYEPPSSLAKTLGNTQPGDGKRFAGHGPLQITGRANHARIRDRLSKRLKEVPDFEASPLMLTTPYWGLLAAADYWVDRGLNEFADSGDHTTLTRKINGGLNGLSDRLNRTAMARTACIRYGL